MASVLLHLVPAPRRVLRAEHVRRSRRRELPQVPGETGEGGESAAGGGKTQKVGEEMET